MSKASFVAVIMFIVPIHAFAADPATSLYTSVPDEPTEIEARDESGSAKSFSKFKRFYFQKEDPLIGGISVGRADGVQSVKFNAINYTLWLGGEYHIPFQVYASDANAANGNQPGDEKANQEKLLDPESGIAIKFPFLWMVKRRHAGICDFSSQPSSIGRCTVGFDIIFNYKDLKTTAGNTQTAAGQTLRGGVSLLFPVKAINSPNGEDKGYLSMAAKLVYSHTNISDSTQLFSPVLDANGNPVKFDKNLFASDVEFKWSFYEKVAITAKWVTPIGKNEYLKDQFRLSMDTQF